MKTRSGKLTFFTMLILLIIFGGSVRANASVRQTGATANSITISWDAPSLTSTSYTRYTVNSYQIYENNAVVQTVSASSTSATLASAANTEHYYTVRAAYTRTSSYSTSDDTYYCGATYAGAAPSAVSSLDFDFGSYQTAFRAAWNPVNSSAYYYRYIVQLKTIGGKVLKQDDSSSSYIYWSGMNLHRVCVLSVTPYYRYGSDGTVFYGPAVTKIVIPQPIYKPSGYKRIKSRAITVKWKKVSGATGYIVYASTSKNKGFKKVATLSRKKTSYTLKKFKKKKLKFNKNYYIIVVTKTKYGKSDRNYYFGNRLYKY